MEIELFGVLDHEGAELSIDREIPLGDFALSDSGPDFPEPVRVAARIVNVGGTLEMSGEVSGSFHVLCARCTKDLTLPFRFPLSETLVPQKDRLPDGEEDVVVFAGTTVDLTEIIISNLFVNLSLKYLCSDDCKGLCPICGADRNIAPCHCDAREIDPRLSVLKNLFDE